MKKVLSTLIVASLATAAYGQYTLVSDFTGLTDGNLNGQGGWITNNGLFDVAADPTDAGNKVMSIEMGEAGSASAEIDFGVNSIANGADGTVFFRMRQDGVMTGGVNLANGLLNAPASSGTSFSQLQSYIRSTDNVTGHPFQARDGGTFDTLHNGDGGPELAFDANNWINVWIYSDNSTNETSVYFDYGEGQVQGFNGSQSDFSFRDGANTSALQAFFVLTSNDVPTGSLAYVDDIYISSGLDLSNPTVIPEPSTYALILGSLMTGLAATLRHRKRKLAA